MGSSKRVAVMTDTNSGVMPQEAEELGIYVTPMPFTVGGIECYEGVNLDAEHFYAQQSAGVDITTSQPPLDDLAKHWAEILEEYDQIVYIPMSSALSGSYDTALLLATQFEGRVFVADCKRISVTQRDATLDAKRWADEGADGMEICRRLEATALDASIYIMVDTLEYLRKSGRITDAVGAIGSALKIKPVLKIQGGKLDAFALAKTLKSAEKTMMKQLKKDVINRFGGVDKVKLYVAHTQRADDAQALAEQMSKFFDKAEVYVASLPLSIACHVGTGAIGIGCAQIQPDLS